jgi:hypothetical protein
MDLSNEQILQIIDFIVNEDNCDTGVFAKFISESNYYSIEGFSNLIKTTKRIFDLDSYDIDFLFHVYNDNYDLILKDNLNAENMVIPVKKNYNITTK